MIFTLLSFVCIFIILDTFGYLFFFIFKRFDKNLNINLYNLIDQNIIGLFALVFLISLLSFFIPLNTNLFICILLFSLFIFFFRIRRRQIKIPNVKKSILLIGVFLILYYLLFSSFVVDVYDAKYYHLQQIEAVFRYPIIKGFANFEDRFGFNSNIFLVQSIFSFKGFLGYHIYPLNTYLFLIIFVYVLKQTTKDYSFFYLLSIVVLLFVFLFGKDYIRSTNPDIAATLIIYYISIRIIESKSIKSIYLFLIPTLALLITIKLSTVILGCISIIPLFGMFRDKKYKTIVALSLIVSLFLATWLCRNVFISGYLVYPYPSIDLFDVDWKVPKTVALIQKEYIRDFANLVFASNEGILLYKIKSSLELHQYLEFFHLIIKALFFITFLFTPFSIYVLFKAKKELLYVYLIFLVSAVFCFIQAPYFRFYIASLNFIIIVNFLCVKTAFGKYFPLPLKQQKVRKISFYVIFGIFIISIADILKYKIYDTIRNENVDIVLKPRVDTRTYSPEEIYRIDDKYDVKINLDSTENAGFTYDIFLSSSLSGYPLTNPAYGLKIQALETIEMRKDKITDGFRTKQEWIEFFNDNEKEIISYYRRGFKQRFNLP